MFQKKQSTIIIRGFTRAKEITKKNARTFYFASLFLNREKRNAAYSIYALCRISDDIIDHPSAQSLGRIKQQIASVYDNSIEDNELLKAFQHTVIKYKIPKHYFDRLMEGLESDITLKRYENFEKLYDYCYKVAGIVGLIMLKIFEYPDFLTPDYALDLSLAMQLTNILRDIEEDYQRGRIYLPQDELKRFGVDETDLAKKIVNDNFKSLLIFQINRARNYYLRCAPGIKMISSLRARLVVYLMKEIYAGILKKIEENNYDVFFKRAQLNLFDKISIAFQVLISRKFL